MVELNNKYTKMQKAFYDGGTSNHLEHNKNPDYWRLFEPLFDKDNSKSLALDFGCGKGRNVTNLKTFNFERVDGVDISAKNIEVCRGDFPGSLFYMNNGVDLQEIPDQIYDFVMSTIVFQHIAVYSIRYKLFQEIYRVMKDKSFFCLQMGTGKMRTNTVYYYDNAYDARGTNGMMDVQIVMLEDLYKDLEEIGFSVNKITILPSFSDITHSHWLYVVCEKNSEKEKVSFS